MRSSHKAVSSSNFLFISKYRKICWTMSFIEIYIESSANCKYIERRIDISILDNTVGSLISHVPMWVASMWKFGSNWLRARKSHLCSHAHIDTFKIPTNSVGFWNFTIYYWQKSKCWFERWLNQCCINECCSVSTVHLS